MALSAKSSEPCKEFRTDIRGDFNQCLCGYRKADHVMLSRRGSEQSETVTFIGEFIVNHGGFRAGQTVDVTRIGTRYRCVLEDKEESFSFPSVLDATKVLRLEEKAKMAPPKRMVVPPAPKPKPIPKPSPPPAPEPSPWHADFVKARDIWRDRCLRRSAEYIRPIVSRPRKYRIKGESVIKSYTEKEMNSLLSNRIIDRRTEIQLLDSKKPWAFAPISVYFAITGKEFTCAPMRPKTKPVGTTGAQTGWVYVDNSNMEHGPVEAREMTRLFDDGVFTAETKIKRVVEKDFTTMKTLVSNQNLFCIGTEPEWLLGGRGFSKLLEVACATCLFPNSPARFLCCVCRNPVIKPEKPPVKSISPSINKSGSHAPSPRPVTITPKFTLKEKDLVVPGPNWDASKQRPREEGYVIKVFPETGECRVLWGKVNSTKHSYINEEVIPTPPKLTSTSSSSVISKNVSSGNLKSVAGGSLSAVPQIVTRFVIPDTATTTLNASKQNALALGMFKERVQHVLKDVKKLNANGSRRTGTDLMDREMKLCRRWVDLCKDAGDNQKAEDFQRIIDRYTYLLTASSDDKFRLDEMVSSSVEQRLFIFQQ